MLFGLSIKTASAIAASIVLVGVVVGAAALADDHDFGTIEAPQWKSGHKWTYDVVADLDYSVDVPGEFADDGTEHFGPFQIKKEILNTKDFSNEGEDLYLGAATLPLGHILDMGAFAIDDWGELAVFPTADRQRDLAPVLVWPQFDCDGYDCEAVGIEFGHDTPVDYIDFPLTYGKRWEGTADFEEALFDEAELGGVTEIRMIGEVGRMETLDLPVGKTDAVRIDFSYQPVGLQKAIAQMREEAEANGVHVDRLNVQLGLHEIAHYSPDYKAVVRDQFVLSFLIDAALEFGGDHFEVFSEASAYTVAELTGAELVDLPERSMPDILDMLNGRQSLKDVSGKAVAAFPAYDVEVTALDPVVNAALEPIVRFDVAVDTADGLPADHTLEYALLDYDGRTVASGPADEDLAVRIREPGVYTMLVGALDPSGALVAQDGAVVIANYEATLQETCGTGAFYPFQCNNGMGVPMNGGLRNAYMEVSVNRTLMSVLGQDNIEFRDSDGNIVSGSRDGSDHYSLETGPMERGVGLLTYNPEMGIGDEVTYHVVADYGALPDYQPVQVHHDVGLLSVFQDWRAMAPLMAPADAALDQILSGEPGEDAFLDLKDIVL